MLKLSLKLNVGRPSVTRWATVLALSLPQGRHFLYPSLSIFL